MAKETTKATTRGACEEYVVEELKALKQKYESLRRDYQELKEHHNHIIEVVQLGTKDFEVRTNDFVCIYFRDSFVALDSKDLSTLKNEVELINLGHRIVRREEE